MRSLPAVTGRHSTTEARNRRSETRSGGLFRDTKRRAGETAVRLQGWSKPRGSSVVYDVKGDRVEIVIDASGDTRTYEVAATRAGRRVDVRTGRGIVEVTELTRGGTPVRTARFMASRVLALVEHPAQRDALPDDERRRAA